MSMIDVRTHDARPLSWWLNEFRRDRIDMQPGYQRRSNLWSRWKKAHLIDSIINGFDVPKFYVADFNKSGTQLQRSDMPYAVIDGKQRFEALFEFLSGGFALNPSAIYHADPEVVIAKLDIFGLREKYSYVAKRLETFEPVVMSVSTDHPSMIDELFVRLNSGISINGAERRNAMPGPVPPIIRDITVHPFFADRVKFTRNRMQEFNLAAKLLLLEFNGHFTDMKAKNLDAFVSEAERAVAPFSKAYNEALAIASKAKVRKAEEELNQALEPYRDAEQRVMETLDVLSFIFEESDDLLGKQNVIPLYYWLVRNRRVSKNKFRDFLEEFDPAVLDNVRVAREDPDLANPRVLSYYNALRTSNDGSSMALRYEMLQEFYREWVAGTLDIAVH